MAVLRFLEGSDAEQVLPRDGESAILGRHPNCDIVLDSAAVSRQHAKISCRGSDYFVEDLQSRNGSFVNGEVVRAPRKLQNGDRLKICDLTFGFYHESPEDSDTTLSSESQALIVDDRGEGSSTIMSKLEVSASQSGLHLRVSADVKLQAMIEISQSLSRAVAVDDVLPKLLASMFKIFVQADRALVILRAPDGTPIIKAVKYRREERDDVRISRTIIEHVMEGKEAILSADAAEDSRFSTSQSIVDLCIRSMMCAPLIDSDGRALGAIQVDTMNQRQRFQEDDLEVLASIASQAAVAIDNAQMHETALRQQAVEHDLKMAEKVQRGLLPAAPPTVPGYHFFDYYEAAYQVGGDYYDYVPLDDNRLAIIVGDVSGKGVSAALLMAKLSGEVRLSLGREETAAAAMNRINENFCRSGWDDRFVTFVLALLVRDRNEVTLVNAGHMPPYLRHADGTVEAVGAEETGLPLGVTSDFEYSQCTLKIEPGELLMIFTDGFSEAMNHDGELYGLKRLTEDLSDTTVDANSVGPKLLANVREFVAGRRQSDDMCLVCFGRDR